MMLTANESAELKMRFKDHFQAKGYDAPMPRNLKQSRASYPTEWAEACEEWEDYEAELDGIKSLAGLI